MKSVIFDLRKGKQAGQNEGIHEPEGFFLASEAHKMASTQTLILKHIGVGLHNHSLHKELSVNFKDTHQIAKNQ